MNLKFSTLTYIRRNRRALRARGLTAADILVLESLAYKAAGGLVRLSCAALGRMTGTSRSTAARHVKRLEAVGAIVRVRSAMMVNVRSVLSWCEDACKDRADRLKSLYIKRHSKLVGTLLPHRVKKGQAAAVGADLIVSRLDRSVFVAELAATYIPVHLRVNR